MQFARDIRDGRFLKPDLTEQTFRDLDNQLVSVFLLGFSFRPHHLTILPNITWTIVRTRALRFPQMSFGAAAGLFNFT
jgi:hypothetical protein